MMAAALGGIGVIELIIICLIGLTMIGGLAATIYVVITLLHNTSPTMHGRPGALVPCPDCHRQISRSAAACPQCGCPLSNQ